MPLRPVEPTAQALVADVAATAWQVETAKDSELPQVPVLLDEIGRRGFKVDMVMSGQPSPSA